MPAAADHEPGRRLIHRLLGQRGRVVARAGAEQKPLALLGDAGRGDVGVQRLGERMMTRHHVMLSAFLMQPELPARALARERLQPSSAAPP